MALNLGGCAFTVSKSLHQALVATDPEGVAARTARPLARLVQARHALGSAPLTFAVVFPYSIHNYLLRCWLADAGVDPDRDVRLVVVPPPRTAEQLRSGAIDGFCVGAPWGMQAVAEGVGEVLVYGSDIWPGAPDKVLGVTQAFAEARPQTLQSLLRALLRAGAWADAPENRAALAGLLARPEHVGLPVEVIAALLTDRAEGPVFHRSNATFPSRSHAAWFAHQMLRWGQGEASEGFVAAAEAVYRPDLYREAAAALGLQAPEEGAETGGAGPA